MNNKFFTTTDPQIDNLIFPLEPKFWWSRTREYPACINHIKEGKIILDAGCGIEHSFKFYIADKAKEIYACDIEDLSFDNIKLAIIKRFGEEQSKLFTQEMYNKVKFNQCDFTSLPYENNKFDYITCISVIEHIDNDTILKSLSEFKRVLKSNGEILLTFDYPVKKPEEIVELAIQSGLTIKGDFNYTLPDNAISSDYFGYGTLYCYSMVLCKEKIKKSK
jgi:SAM-dependent methyltransferase